MVVTHAMHSHPSGIHFHDLSEVLPSIIMAFRPVMLPWAIAFIIIGLLGGIAHGLLLSHMEKLVRRRNAELKKAEQRFRSLVDSATDAIISADGKGTILSWNKGAEVIFGYKPKEILGKTVETLMPKQFRDDHRSGLERRSSTQRPGLSASVRELKGLRKDGGHFPLELALSEWTIERSTFFTAIIRDISDRKVIEKKLEESEVRHRTLVESSSDLIGRLDLDGNFLYMSPVGLAAHGVSSAAEIIGVHCTRFAEPAYSDLFFQKLQEASEGQPATLQHETRTVSGMKWFESNITPITGHKGHITSFIIIARDISNRKKAEAEKNSLNIELQKSLRRTKKTLWDTVTSLASVAEVRDPYTSGHQRRVAELARAIARHLELPEEQTEGIYVAGLVHDIGKISVPAEILTKPTKLKEIEFEMIKEHPQVSYDVLRPVEFPWPIAQIVLQHHERLDGSGYPNGVSGDDILIEAKILAVADVVEAMASHRPYRPSLGFEAAFQHILENKGTLYDARAVTACVQTLANKKFDFDQTPAATDRATTKPINRKRTVA